MKNKELRPNACRTMEEVRQGVDRLDKEIVALLAERFGYMKAAARIKPHREQVRDEMRKAQVLSNVRGLADRAGIKPDLIADLYESLIEASIEFELRCFDGKIRTD